MTETRDKVIIEYASVNFDKTSNDVKTLQGNLAGITEVSFAAEKSTASLENKFASLERRFQTTAAQTAQYEKIQKDVNLAVANNPALQGRANEVLAAAEARYLGAGKAVTELASAHKGLDAQGQAAFHSIRSVVEQLALGIPPTQALTGQLNHLSFAASGEGGLAGAFGQVGGFVKNLISPTTAAIGVTAALAAAVAYAAVQYDKLQVSSQRAISGAGARTGTTTTDLNSFVDKNTPSAFSGSTLSQKESRALGEGLTQTGDIVISKLQSMSAAVVGFSNQTGQSMDESVKAFAKMGSDPVKAMDELAKAFGPFSQGTRTLVQDMVAAGDKTLAWNAILGELGPTAKGTAGNMTTAEMAARGLVNVLQISQKPTGLEKQLEDVRQKLSGAIEAANQFAAHGVEVPSEASNSIAVLNKQFDGLYARQQAVIGLKVSSTFDDLADKARVATEAVIPQIAQIEQLKNKLEELNQAKAAGATSRHGADVDAAAATTYQNQIAALKEAEGEASRYNEMVKAISQTLVLVNGEWINVSQSAALALRAAENQLPVLQAVTNAQKMTAQYAADYANAMDKGKTATDATALAASNLQAAQAQASATAQQGTQQLANQNQLQAAGYVSQYQGQTKLSDLQLAKAKEQAVYQQQSIAKEQAYNQVLKDGGTQLDAQNRSREVGASYQNQIKSAAEQVKVAQIAINDATAQWRAELLGVGTAVEVIGADYSKILQAQSQIDQATAQYNQQQLAAGKSSYTASFDPLVMPSGPLSFSMNFEGSGGPNAWTPKGALGDYWSKMLFDHYNPPISATNLANNTLSQGSGGVDSAIAAIQKAASTSNYGSPVTDALSGLQTLYGIKNQTADNSTKITNDQQFLSWLQGQPQTVENLQAIASLTTEIQNLATATGANTSATSANTDALSPYYTQDPRTSHIGFRSQGMATGGEFTVPGGYSANDNMVGTIPLASGEIVSVRRPGENSGGGSKTPNITIHMPITIQGSANKDEVGRTMYQASQSLARQLQATAR